MPHPSEKIIFDEQQLRLIEQLAGIRMEQRKIAHILGCSRETFQRRIKDCEATHNAYYGGIAKASSRLHKVAFEMACSGKYPMFTAFYLKCQENWREEGSFDFEEKSYPDPED